MICKTCRHELAYDFKFCPECGARVGEPGAGQQARAGEGSAAAAGRGIAQVGQGHIGVSGSVGGDLTIFQPPPPGADPAALREAYLHRLVETAGHLSLSGVDPKAASSEAEARLNLGAVYTALLTLTPEANERLLQGGLPDRGRESQRLSAMAQLDREPRLVLLGDPGSGKTTFVHFVTLCLAGEGLGRPEVNLALLTAPLPADEEKEDETPPPQPWSHGVLLPVCIVLRDFAARGLPPAGERASAEHLWRFITAELEAAALGEYGPHLRQELLKQGGLLLLDGLDEVPAADRRREQIKQAVEDFAATFRRCRVLVTSRTYAYQKQDWRLRGFVEAVLAPFGVGQIRRFVDRWYAHVAALRGLHADDAQGRAELLKRAILGSERLRGLAERPLLLTLMASLHAWRGGSLPEKREELYADTVELLLDWWESPKTVRDARGQVMVLQPSLAEWLKVDRDRVRDLLDELAYRAHAAQPETMGTADVAEGDLVCGLMRVGDNPDVKQGRLVEFLSQRAGLLLPRGVGVYTFPHRTFQEYLAACHLTDHDYPDRVARLAREDPGRWREVALLAGAKAARGTASAVWALVDALCYRDLPAGEAQAEADAWGALLAGQALVESAGLAMVSERNRPKLERVRTHLTRLLEGGRLPAVERAAAGRSLARLGDPRPGVGLGADGLPDIAWCEVPAGPFLMGDEKTRIEVAYPYAISQYPVTNAQYHAFVESGGYRERRYWHEAEKAGVWHEGRVKMWQDEGWREDASDYGAPFNLPNHPAVGMTWYEAVAFCRWLTTRMEEWADEWMTGWEVRLPTEAEWEKAARGADGREYPWGDAFDPEKCNTSETGLGATSAVGCFPDGASPYDALDTSGNVWEWCRSLYKKYPYRADDGREDLEAEGARVLRGGAFRYVRYDARCAYRYNSHPGYRYGYVGFRVVVAPALPF